VQHTNGDGGVDTGRVGVCLVGESRPVKGRGQPMHDLAISLHTFCSSLKVLHLVLNAIPFVGVRQSLLLVHKDEQGTIRVRDVIGVAFVPLIATMDVDQQ